MKRLSLRERIHTYLKNNKGVWIHGGYLEKMAIAAGYKGSSAGRRSRELHEDGMIYRKEISGKVWYMYDLVETKQQQTVEIVDNKAIISYKTVEV